MTTRAKAVYSSMIRQLHLALVEAYDLPFMLYTRSVCGRNIYSEKLFGGIRNPLRSRIPLDIVR